MEAGHEFLARMGKTRLRPGGIEGTGWLMDHSGLNEESKVLEVACNMGTTMLETAERYGCDITGVDRYEPALEKARKKIEKAGLSHRLRVVNADATNLPFPDNTFDVVINEAMLTMMNQPGKEACVREYFRVLKPGGVLLTHDIMTIDCEKDLVRELQGILNVSVKPMPEENWVALFEGAGFSEVEHMTGELNFLTKDGLIRDEGMSGFLRIMGNAVKEGNIKRFFSMKEFFDRNHEKMRYIVFASRK